MALRSSSSPSWAVEMALQELQKLESEHPDRFDYLKRELKSLIAEPLFTSRDPTIPTLLPASSAATQVSSNRKRKFDGHMEEHGKIRKRVEGKKRECLGGSKCGVERAIQRAEACLKRIQQLKHSLFPF
ncbi:uncharacterized protein LOC109714720 [Ananas comosus]|uniref:Uncharacterized protein LOC109714720 n=1 Tax=Ananas comosus TaxID=4615 RepID=A0A6P5FNG3_ANACO|nr:uncharacterized protein LOC109714720 [Ananas comosus]